MFESKDLEVHKGKYYGLYRGYVVDNKDPEGMGRLRVSVPSALGIDDETDEPLVSGWAYPKFPIAGKGWGLNLIPPVKNLDGSKVMVWVEFEQGDIDYPVWSGCPISQNALSKETKTNQAKINSGKTSRPTFSFSTPDGRRIVLDDTMQKIIITDTYKTNNHKTPKTKHTIEFDGDNITISCSDLESGDTSSVVVTPKTIVLDGNVTLKGKINVSGTITGDANIQSKSVSTDENIAIGGSLNVNDNISVNGEITSNGNISTSGSISASGSVHGSNI